MSVLIRRISDQTREFLKLVDENGNKRAAVDVDGKYFGDASRITGILKPFDPETGNTVNVTDTDGTTATDNAELIQDALDAAATDPEIDTIKLPNAKIFSDRLTLGFRQSDLNENVLVNHSGLTIEGGGKTFVVNKYHPRGLGVIFANPQVIGYFDAARDYQPGDPDVTVITVYCQSESDANSYQAGELVYLSPRYVQQPIEFSRLCQMNSIVSVDPDGTKVGLTLATALPTDLEATTATATLNGDAVDDVAVAFSYGAGYDATMPPRVQLSGGYGTGAEVKAIIGDGALSEIVVTDGGSGYTSAPAVIIGAPPGDGVQATATANLDGTHVASVTIEEPGSGYDVPPSISFISGGPGSGAAATAVIPIAPIQSFVVTNPGSGYLSAPTVTIDPPPLFAKWVRGGRKVASVGLDYVVMENAEDAALFPVDSYVWLCTGPAYDDSDGRYFRVRKFVTGLLGRVYFAEALRPEDFIENRTCLIPGPFVENVAIRNFMCGGFEEQFGGNWAFNLQNCVHVSAENVQMLPSDPSLIIGNMGMFRSQYVQIRGCLAHLENQGAHNLSVMDCVLNDYVTHSHCTETVFYHCRISQYDGVHSALGSGTVRFTFRDCEFNLPTTRIDAPEGQQLIFDNCRVVNTSDVWSFDGPGIRFSNVKCDTIVAGAISFGPNCYNCILENVTTSSPTGVTFDSGSTGSYLNLSEGETPPDGWRTPVRLLEFPKIDSPGAPNAEDGFVFMRVDSDQTQLCVRFHTGGVQVIASES